ncbi:unnamed protein product [Rhizoctonia solani]|uniref:Lysine-specific metallo-endopeptidase domain-containing protein n=1 Tax=Rhizoctonia solani TaxID=456999 RepID=A0A8H3D1C6_9AGAM|nr:unnamed protein product [Rhizoctonia solani]CAE7226399.1 unnamed protein product [Rhizoctonia solani]
MILKLEANSRHSEKPVSLENMIVHTGISSLTRRINHVGCTPNQKIEIDRVVLLAQSYARSSYDHLESNPTGSALYTRWFGKFDQDAYKVILERFKRLSELPTTWRYGCTCSRSGILFWPDAQSPRKIEICPSFWSATGVEPKVIALIREGTRFGPEFGTSNKVLGRFNCELLAKTKPKKAVNNAE